METILWIIGLAIAFVMFVILRNTWALYKIKTSLPNIYAGVSNECYKNYKSRQIASDLVEFADRLIDSDRTGRVMLVKHAHRTSALSSAQILYAEALKRNIQAYKKDIDESYDLLQSYEFLIDCFDDYLKRRAEGIKATLIIDDLKETLYK